jgi:hypothetical protein
VSVELLVTVICLAVLVCLITLVVLLVRRMGRTGRVLVSTQVLLGGDAASIEPEVMRALQEVEGATYAFVSPARHSLTLRRTPIWVVVPLLLTFPLGLLFLMIRESVRMDIALYNGPEGAVVALSGSSEKDVLERVLRSLHALSPSRPDLDPV